MYKLINEKYISMHTRCNDDDALNMMEIMKGICGFIYSLECDLSESKVHV